MVSIEEYLELLDLPNRYELDGVRKSLADFDGVSVPQDTGDREFYGWRLKQEENRYRVVLSQDTPGDRRELGLDEFANRLETGEFIPTIRTDQGYKEVD